MKEDAFYERLREGFNDIFLTVGIDDPVASILSYEHFTKTRTWTQKFDLNIVPEKERQKARYKLDADYRKALLGEPMKLIEHIVKSDRPFTEIITADYIMITPFSARGYGIFDDVKDKFKNPDDPFEYVAIKLKALKGRSKSTDQESATGDYPHAGMLSTFQWMRRYPTTQTNRNRLRARMDYQHFLVVDALDLAARVSDAAAVTRSRCRRDASECVVCHGRSIRSRVAFRITTRSKAFTAAARVAGTRTCSRPASKARSCRRRNAGVRCNGSASALRRTRVSPSPWSSTCTTC